MKKYTVQVPVVGYYVAEVKAENEKDAISKACYEYDWKLEDLQECESFERIVQGNVINTYNHTAEVLDEEEIEDDEWR